MSLDGAKKPDHLITFAGVDKEAVDAARHVSFSSIITIYGVVQKRRISSHVRASPH
jgi:hypothetical protein